MSFRPVVLRNGAVIEDPLGVMLGLLKAYRLDVGDASRPVSFGEPDLRLANRDGARISAAEIAAILDRRRAIERALRAIAPQASLAGAASSVPSPPLGQLFDAFAGIRGVGMSKMTKALYRKRPSLIPILDSIIQKYLEDDDLGAQAPFGERALARWLTVTGLASAVLPLVAAGTVAWIELLFPGWILALSIDILLSRSRADPQP